MTTLGELEAAAHAARDAVDRAQIALEEATRAYHAALDAVRDHPETRANGKRLEAESIRFNAAISAMETLNAYARLSKDQRAELAGPCPQGSRGRWWARCWWWAKEESGVFVWTGYAEDMRKMMKNPRIMEAFCSGDQKRAWAVLREEL